jgi:hypothetical protein
VEEEAGKKWVVVCHLYLCYNGVVEGKTEPLFVCQYTAVVLCSVLGFSFDKKTGKAQNSGFMFKVNMDARDEITGQFLKRDANERFWSKVKTAGPNDCWEWQGSRDQCGYAMFWLGERTLHATRAYFIMMGIEMTENVVVCHKCDNPNCVNPNHLFLGTTKDNVDDKIRKGRASFQTGKPHKPYHRAFSKLNDDMVREIREIQRRGKKGDLMNYAKSHGISPRTIYHVTCGGGWKHIQ